MPSFIHDRVMQPAQKTYQSNRSSLLFDRFHVYGIALLLTVIAWPAAGQVVSDSNQVKGTFTITNTNPDILSVINFSSMTVNARSLNHDPLFTSSSNTLRIDPTKRSYELTLEAGPVGDGIEYRLNFGTYKVQNWIYNQPTVNTAPVEAEPAPDQVIDVDQCMAMVVVKAVDATTGEPLVVNRIESRGYRIDDDGSSTYRSRQRRWNGSQSKHLHPDDGKPSRLTVTAWYDRSETCTTYLTTSKTFELSTLSCDQVQTVEIPIPEDDRVCEPPPTGALTGNVDLIGENVDRVLWTSDSSYWLYGPFPQGFDDESITAPRTLRTYPNGIFSGTGLDFQRHRTSTQLVTQIEPDQTTDLGDTFVMIPARLQADAHIVGPPDVLSGGGESCIADLYRDIERDSDGDGIPNDIYFRYGTVVTTSGDDILAPGATLSAQGAYAQRTFSGDYDPSLAEIVGDIDFALGHPYNEDSFWNGWAVRYRLFDTARPGEPETYSDSQLTLIDRLQDPIQVSPGAVSTHRDIRGCFSEVRMHFLSLAGTFYQPHIRGSANFDGTDFDGERNFYTVASLDAYGTPTNIGTASDEGLVRMCLPQGSYNFDPTIIAVNPGGGTSNQSLASLSLNVGCRQVIDLQADLQLLLDEVPRCVAEPNLTLTGSVNGTFPIGSVIASVDGTETTGCVDCGENPAFSIPVGLNACTNNISVTATDSRGETASAATTSSVDTAPPSITSQCEDVEVSVQYPATGTAVTWSYGATDACDGSRPVVCDHPSGSIFPIGDTLVSCVATDQCGFTDSCQFTVTVNEEPIEDGNEQCYFDEFDDDTISTSWNIAAIGDAGDVSAEEVDGEIHLTGTGSSLYHEAEDHGAFLYRQTELDDFRAELTVTDEPTDGETYRKATLMVRAGLEADAPRVMVSYAPGHPAGPSVMFDVRHGDGTAQELGSTVSGVDLPLRLAVQRIGSELSVYFHNGSSWVLPAGGLGGNVLLDLGPEPLVGAMVTSYDGAAPATFAFDDFELCEPQTSLPDPGGVCDGSDLDLVYLLDQSASMAEELDDGTVKSDAARDVLRHVTAAMAYAGDHRGAVVTATAAAPPLDHPTVLTQTLQGLTTDFGLVDGALDVVPAPSPDDATPLADGLRRARELLENTADPNRRPVLLWTTDGLPTVDGSGNGPVFYLESEVSGVSLKQADGTFRSKGAVAWSGNFNPVIGTRDGEAPADAMAELEKLMETFPDLRILTLMPATTAQPGYPDLADYAAYLGDGLVVPLTAGHGTGSDVESAARSLLDDLICGEAGPATLAGRVWHDADGDGSVGSGEDGIAGVDVTLSGGSGTVATATTDGDGAYAFTGLAAGTYTVSLDVADLPAVLDQATFDADGTATSGTSTVTVAPWDLDLGQHFGYAQSSGTVDGCLTDTFDTGNLDAAWTLTALGDADQVAADVVAGGADGELHLTGDGTTLYAGTDNGAFVYRPVTGDFVAETELSSFPVDAGGAYHKAGIMLRQGLGSTDARIMVQHIPRWNNGSRSALQFRYRASDGGPGDGALGSNRFDVPLPARLRIARTGDTFSVAFSTDGGATWTTPTGGSGGSITLDWDATLLLGLNVVSYHPTVTTTAAFEHFQVCAPGDAP